MTNTDNMRTGWAAVHDAHSEQSTGSAKSLQGAKDVADSLGRRFFYGESICANFSKNNLIAESLRQASETICATISYDQIVDALGRFRVIHYHFRNAKLVPERVETH